MVLFGFKLNNKYMYCTNMTIAKSFKLLYMYMYIAHIVANTNMYVL